MTINKIADLAEKRCSEIKLPFKKRLRKKDLLLLEIGYAKCIIDVLYLYSNENSA